MNISAADTQKVEGLYYKAVGAYSNNEMGTALAYIDEIAAIHPSYRLAAELRGKIVIVSGTGKLRALP